METPLLLVFEHDVNTFIAINLNNRANKSSSNSTTTLRLSKSMLLYDDHHTRGPVTLFFSFYVCYLTTVLIAQVI
jgi:hypothetical protein